MFQPLDPLLHQQVRLAIVSLLIGLKSAEFSYLLENIDTTKGNLSFQLSKLNEVYQKKNSGNEDANKMSKLFSERISVLRLKAEQEMKKVKGYCDKFSTDN